MFKIDIEPISARLKNNRGAHEVYIEKTIEYADTLCGFIESARTQNPSEPLLESACIGKLVAVKPINKDKRVRFVEPVTPSNNIPKQTDSLKTKDSNKPLLTSTGVKPTTSASGSKPLGNTKNNRISRPPRSNQKSKVEDHSRTTKSSLNKMNYVSEPINNALVKHSVRNAKFESVCAICNKCLFDANHDMCLVDFVNDVNVSLKSKSKRNKKRKAWKPMGKVFTDIGYKKKPTGRFFTIVGNSCPLTRITPKKIVHLKETTPKLAETSKPEIKVYSRRPKKIKLVGSSKQAKIVESKPANNSEPTYLWGSNATDVPFSSSFVNDRLSRSSFDNGTEFVNQTLCDFYENVSILHQTLVARTPQQNGVVKRQNRTLMEAARTMLIFSKAPMFLWAEGINTACYTQNRSLIRLRCNKNPYELMHDKKPDLSFFHVFGSLCYPTNDSEDLGKLNAKADIGIFIRYALAKKSFRIYNRRTQKIIETIHVTFDELTTMASEQFSSGPGLQVMTPATSSSGLVPNIIPQQPCVEESPKTLLFHDDPLHEFLHEDSTSQGSSSNKRPSYTPFELIGRWTKDHPIANVIGDPSRSVGYHVFIAFCFQSHCALLKKSLRFASKVIAFCLKSHCVLLKKSLRFASKVTAFCLEDLAFCSSRFAKDNLRFVSRSNDTEAEAVQIILTGIDNDIYSTVDACPNACEMWKAIERLKQGESINVQDLETNLYWEFRKFTSRDGESLESYYSRFYKMMNELVRNQCHVTNHQVNVQFLLQLQPEWQRFVTLVKQSQELKTVSYHKLYDILKQHQNKVNEIRAERLARTANPLALVAQQQPVYHHQNHPTQNTQYSSTRSQQSTRNRGKAIVTSSAPTYDPEPATVTKDEEMSKEKEIDKLMALISLSFKKIYKPTNNNLRTSSNTSRANQDNSPRINRGTGYDNQRVVNVVGARENVGTPVVQKYGIQCYNCKEYRHVSRECQKPKRVKDATYHKEKMLLCKQEEAGVQLNAEQADWKDDTDDESEEQELEAHYMYMAQLQEVTPDPVDNSGPIFDDEPMHKVQNNNDNYNVFAMENEHPEQPESSNDIYLAEHGDTNITIDSLDICYDRAQDDQDETDDLDQERDLLASLIQKLKCEIDDSKNRNKFLESSNKELVDKLKGEIEDFKTKNKSLESSNNHFKEANNELSKTNQLMFKDLKKFQAELDKYNDVNYASKVEIDCAKAKGDLMSYKIDFEKSSNAYTQKINDLNQTISDMKKELCAHQETISIMSQAKEAQIKLYKTREDKELDKVIALENKVKVLNDIVYKTGQSVQTMNMLNRNCKTSFAKPEFLKKAQRANPRLYDIGCYNDNLALMLAPDSDETIRLEKERRSKLSDLIRPFDYDQLNNLYDLFVPQREKSAEQHYFPKTSKMSHTSSNKEFSKESFRVIPTTSVSRPQLKSNHLEYRVMSNNSQGKKQEVKSQRRILTRRDNSIHRRLWVLKAHDRKSQTSNTFFVDTISWIRVKLEHDQIAPILGYRDFGSHGTDLYSITLQDSTTYNPICLMAKAISSQAWLWH
ncbi:gag-pol polyprotein, partial [Tanacetum coccineum]